MHGRQIIHGIRRLHARKVELQRDKTTLGSFAFSGLGLVRDIDLCTTGWARSSADETNISAANDQSRWEHSRCKVPSLNVILAVSVTFNLSRAASSERLFGVTLLHRLVGITKCYKL